MPPGTYDRIIEHIFFAHFRRDREHFEFEREEIQTTADELGIRAPRNLGDVIYSYRYRRPLPKRIRDTCGEDEEWVIRGVAAATYQFHKVPVTKIEPRPGLY
jgi:hypothetical protein